MDFYKGNIPILEPTASSSQDTLHPQGVEFGYVERDYAQYPEEMFSPPSEMEIIPKTEWDARFEEQEANKSSLEHIYLSGPNGEPAFVNLDQNGDGYCWSYSTGHAMMIDRLKQNLPPIRLNPHGPAAIIKGGANQGGWCGLSAKFARENGYPVEGTGPGQWPLHSRNLKYDTPECRAQMAKHKVEEDWVDMTRQVYDQNLTTLQVATCGFTNTPNPSDFNWWGHSVCQIRWVRIEAGSWGPLILNSWKGWGRHGLAVLRGSQGVCNGGVAFRMTSASAS
jgi:hypothetical protein